MRCHPSDSAADCTARGYNTDTTAPTGMNRLLNTQQAEEQLQLWRLLRITPEIFTQIDQQTGSPLQRQTALRKQFSPELVRLALELAEVRERAGEKFVRGSQLWLTRQAFEQATSESVASYKARRFERYTGSDVAIHDYCSGLGSDAIALAKYAPVNCYDLDPVMLQLAQWNAELCGVHNRIKFLRQDTSSVDVTGQVIHIDPDQRDSTGRRHLRLEQIQPELTKLQAMAAQCRGGAIKLSPASNFGGKFPDCEIELVSLNRECKLATVWCGELGEPGLWRATVLPQRATLAGDPLSVWPSFSGVETYLYDPDPSVVRAGLINLLADSLSLNRLDDADEYLTGTAEVESSFVTGFAVRDVLNRNEKQLRKYLRDRNIGSAEIKCRQVPLDVEKLRRSLRLSGENSVTLIYARVSGKTQVLVCDRL
jgi:hypothetical protein